jgi:hypothetical protein
MLRNANEAAVSIRIFRNIFATDTPALILPSAHSKTRRGEWLVKSAQLIWLRSKIFLLRIAFFNRPSLTTLFAHEESSEVEEISRRVAKAYADYLNKPINVSVDL